MCGIVGFISIENNYGSIDKKHFLRFALALDTLRGQDSTGLITLEVGGSKEVYRSLMPGDQWVGQEEFKNINSTVAAAIGHNRAATKGKVNIKNAHPFEIGPITMVHNGTLMDDGRSLDTFDKKFKVDSKQIALALSDSPPEDATKVLSKIYGSFALVWYDSRDNSVNIARNNERPFHMCWNNTRKIMWFMSDGDHLRAVNKSLNKWESGGEDIYSLSCNKHLKFTLGGSLKPHAKAFETYRPPLPPRKTHRQNQGYYPYRIPEYDKNKERHREQVDRYRNTLKSEVRVEINGKKRAVPEPQEKALKECYELQTRDFLEFLPFNVVGNSVRDTITKKVIVAGKIIHESWGYTPWPAVVMDAALVQAKAYKSVSWLVRPVGMAKPLTKDNPDVPHILCELIHCDWESWKQADREAEQEYKREQKADMSVVIAGPEGKWMPRKEIQTLLDAGCAQCLQTITEEDMKECIFVNEGRDLLCALCQDEMTAWEIHMSSQLVGKIH